jgi:ribonuclease HI
MNIGSGRWKAKANKELATRVRSLWGEVNASFFISTEHVRAHEGHRWNERADHLAFRAMKEEMPLPLQFWKPGRR